MLVLSLLLFSGYLRAQNSKGITETIAVKTGDTLRLAHPYLVPYGETVTVGDFPVAESKYEIDYVNGTLIVLDEGLNGDSITVRYRYFPDFLDRKFAFRTFRIRKDTSKGEGLQVEEYYQGEQQVVLIPSNIRKSGSISRGITVGNNQNLSVTSGLRLQLEGDLGDDLKLQAAITDETIPIQPDGTTQQINDFDKVFIQLLRRDDKVILGDFEINHRGTNFANFYRNVQGLGVHIQEKNFRGSLSGAVAKGKFHTNSFQGQEGVQGPYRLSGENNERFIIVLAGSEKVFLNGEMMTRGEGNDYTMDYNTGELRFTSQRVITSASRIVVDFEYTDRFYNRSLFFTEFGVSGLKNKLNIKGSYGRDADNQNAPIDGEFSDPELDSLAAAGDSDGLAIISGIDSVGAPENESAIHYARRDTVIGGLPFERYVFSNDPDSAIYRITFTQVGAGQGMYTREQSAVNGTVFRWVAPDSATGPPKGDYAPIKILVPAQLHQVLDVAADYKISDKATIYTEIAVSSEDKNRQSPLEDADNADIANKTGLRFDKLRLGDSLNLRVDVSHRYVGQRYENIDRVYKVEYGREWNFNDLGERLGENVTEAVAELRYSNQLRFLANTGVRTYGTRLFSVKQLYEAESKHKWLQGKYKFTTISTEDRVEQTFSRWSRHNGDVYKTIGKFRPGSEIWMEDKSNLQDGVSQNGAFRFYDFKPYIRTVDSEKLNLYLFYNYRKEIEYLDTLEREKSIAHTGYAKIIYNPISNLSLQNTSSLRDFKVLDNKFLENGLNNSQTFITNFQGSFFTAKRIFFSNLIYEVTSEQLARKQVAYIEVNPGQGDYEWIDADSNGVQDLDEFQFSTNPNRSNFFVRVLVPTTELFPTTALNFSGNFKLDFKRAFKRSKRPLREIVRNFSSITNFRAAQKKTAGTDLETYLVNLGDIFADTSLLDAQYTFRQDIYFFRNNQVGDIKFSYADNQSKLFLASGDETRSLRFYGSSGRLNFGSNKSFENEFRIGEKRSQAQEFDSRNFDIEFIETKPKMNFQINRKFRVSAGYEFKHKENRNDSARVDATVNFHKLIFDAKLNLKDRNNIFAKLELVNIGQEGNASFSAEYELRESLQPGFNAIWQVFTTIYLTKTLELSVTYDGRAAEDRRVLHTGRMQIKAFF